MTRIRAISLGIICLGFSAVSADACDAVVDKIYLPMRDFYDPTAFGTLGVQTRPQHLLLLNQASCYDVSDKVGDLSVYFNFATNVDSRTRNPTYLAVQVISELPNRRGAQPELSLARNKSRHADRGKWANIKDEDLESDVKSYRASQLDMADPMFDRTIQAANGDQDMFMGRAENKDYPRFREKFGKWHAMLVAPAAPAPNSQGEESYTVIHNTWKDREIWQLRDGELRSLVKQNSFRIRQHLISFRPFKKSGASQPPYHVAFRIGTNEASCVYIRLAAPPNSDWSNSFAISMTDQRFVALRTRPGAECAGGRPRGWLEATRRWLGPRRANASP